MSFTLTAGIAPPTLPNFFNMSGLVTALTENNDPNLNYAPFMNGGSINFTFTGTTYTGGADSFASVISTVGSGVVANGSFSQQSVPEPSSMALLGIGMTAFLVARRFFRKPVQQV